MSLRLSARAGRVRRLDDARRRRPTNGKAKRGYDLTQLREWAGANKVTVPSRGRIPQAVVEQYKAAGGR